VIDLSAIKLGVPNHSSQLLLSHRRLLWQVALNELKARYAGSVFGVGWAVLTPLLFLAIYAGIYLIIFKVQVPGLSSVQYVLLIFSGLVPFLMTSEALVGGVSAVVVNKSVLSNTVFPIDLAPAKAVLLSQVPMIVGFAAIIIALAVTGTMSWTIVLLPLIWGLHILALIGLNWILSLVNLVFRDLQNLIGIMLMALMIVSPIAYTPEMVPSSLKILLLLNPFAYFVIAYQAVVILGQVPSWGNSLVLIGLSGGLFILGGYFFSRAKQVLIDYV
jgi:lipopolysaccharide transport system permease protein